jgi:hypothetical protein
MKRLVHFGPAILILLVGATVFLWQRQTTHRLQRELAARREALRDLSRLREENEKRRQLLAVPEDGNAIGRVKAEIARLRQELTALEQKPSGASRAGPPPARPPADRAAAERLVEKDAVRIADFKNQGQATPGAAFQTLVWALARDDFAALKPLLHLSPVGQEKLQAIWRELPADSQLRFKEPEQILMLLLALDVLDEEALAIAETPPQDSGDALLRVSRFKNSRLQGEKRIPMRKGLTGWQLVIPEEAIETLPEAIAQASLYVAPQVKRQP